MIRYYAFATNPAHGKFEQLIVTKERPSERSTQEWTGVVYKSFNEADADVLRLNTLAGEQMMPMPHDLDSDICLCEHERGEHEESGACTVFPDRKYRCGCKAFTE